MPIYEFECINCGNMEERLFTSVAEGEELSPHIMCRECSSACKKVLSRTEFKVTGFNAKNGYNLPNYNDVVDEHGYAKPEWGKNK